MATPERYSANLIIMLRPSDIAMFRFLLEAYENLAFFTVLDKRQAIIKLIFAGESKNEVMKVLEIIKKSVPLEILQA